MGIFEAPGRVSGKTYKLKIKGDTPSETEQARIRAFVEEQENAFAANYEARYGAPLAVDDGTALGRGWEMGKAGAFSRLGTATEYLGSGLGLESLVNVGKGMRASGEQEAFLESLRQPAPTELKDVTGLGSALTYLGEGIGQSGPEMLAPLAATAAGTIAGTAATGNPFTGGVIGAGAGAATAFPSFFGGNIQRQEGEVAAGRKAEVDVSDAIVSAVGQSALNTIGDKLLLGGFLKPGQKWLTRTAVGAGEGAAVEVPTEIAQQIIERKQAGLPLDDDDAIYEYVNAGILGGVMGGGIRATTAGLGIGMEKEVPPAAPPGTTPAVPPTPTITPDEDISPEDAQAAADEVSGFDGAPTEAEVPEAAPTPIDVPTIGDSRIGAGVSVDEDLVEARAVYDERLAIAEESGADTAEAQRIAAESTLNYIDSLDDGAKQRLSRFRAIMAKTATAPTAATPTTGEVMPPDLPDSAYAAEFEAGPQSDLFAAPSARKIAEAEAEADARAATPTPETRTAPELKPIPFDQYARKPDSEELIPGTNVRGEAPIIDLGGRKIVMRDVNGVQVPFYLSSGLAGKKDVAAGKWYPILGIGPDGWINKGSQQEINDYYGSPELRTAAQELDATIGDIRNDTSVPKVKPTGAHIDAINAGLNPTANEEANTRDVFNANLASLLARIKQGAGVTSTAEAAPEAAPEVVETRPAAALDETPKPTQVLTEETVDRLGVGKAKSASLRKLIGAPLTDTKVIRALDSWAQNDRATPENKALAVSLITGQPAPEAPATTVGDGWKLHLNPVPGSEQAISDYLTEKKIPHKVGRASGQVGKGMTVYVGSRDAANAVAADINSQFADSLNDAEGDVLTDDTPIAGKVWGRFDAPKNPAFHQYGAAGVPFLNEDMSQLNFAEDRATAVEEAKKRADALLRRRYGTYYTGGADVTEAAAAKPEEVGAGAPSGGPSVEGSGRPADDTGSPEGVEAPESGGLGGDLSLPVGTAATEGAQPAALSELEEQLVAARAEAAALRKKVPVGVLERELVGGAVDPVLAKTVANLQNVLARQEKTAETAKAAVPAKATHPARPKKLKAYEDALAKLADTRRQLAVAQDALSTAELAASLQRGAQPKAQATGKAATAYTDYINALRRADVLRQQTESARAQQTSEANAPLPTGLRDSVIPGAFTTYQRGFTTKPIAPQAAVKAVADDVRKEAVFRRLIQYFKQRATPSMLQYTTIGNGINDPKHWKTFPDWMSIDDQSKVAALLGRLNRAEREKYKFTLAEVEPLSSDAEAAHTYFSKTIRPVDAIDMMVADLTVDYEIYEGSLKPGRTEIEVRDLLIGTGSEVAKRALNWVRANLSAKTNAEIDLVLKKQDAENSRQETLLDNMDRVEVSRAKRKAAKTAQAQAATESGYGPFEVASKMAADDPLVEMDKGLHYSVVAALNAGDLKGALQALAATTNNSLVKALASRFSELTGTTRVKVLYPGDPSRNIGSSRGIYWQARADGDPERQNIIYLNGQTGMSAHVLLHEMAHAVTARFIEAYANHPLVKQLESLLSSLRQAAPKDILYVNAFRGLLDVKEMTAEAYGRVAFGEVDNGLRDLMKATTFTTETPTTRELPLTNWERFKEIVGNIFNFLLGRPSKPYPRRTVGSTIYGKETALDRFHRLVDGMLSEAPQVLPDAALQQAVGNNLTAITTLNNAIKSAPVWNAAGRAQLADLMMSSVPMWLRRALLAPMQLEWFNDLAGEYFPQIAALKVIDDLRRGNIRRLEQAAAPVISQLAKYAEANPELYSVLMSIMGTATRLEVDPTKPQSTYAADPEKLRVWHDLNRQLRTSDTTGKMRDLFKTTRSLFEAYRNEMLDVLRTRVKELTDDTAMQNQIYKRLVDKLDADGVIDPYFSLMRQGDYWLVYTAEDNTAAPVAVDPLGTPQRPTTQYVQAFTSAWARNAFRAKLEAAKDANGKPVAWDIKEDRRPKITRQLRGNVPHEFVQGAINIINTTVPKTSADPAAEQRAAAAREAIEDLFISFLPEQSIMKSFSKRKGVRGFIGDITPIGVVDRPQDMVSVLETKSHSIAFQLSNMKYGSEVQRLMSKADETLKKLKQTNLSAGESVAVEAYYDEFIARATYAKSPTVSDAAQLMRGVTFGFTLGASIAGAANNLMQLVMVALPELAARYGGVRAVNRELMFAKNALTHAGKTQKVLSYGPDGRAVRELTSIDNYGSIANYMEPTVTTDPVTGEERFGYKLRDDMNIPPKLRAKLADMDVLVEVLANNDMLGGSTNQELLESTSNAWRKINRVSGFLMHHTERFNRQMTAVAAYNLELGKLVADGATPDYETKLAAAKKAVELTERVNGSIGAAQGSRISFNSVGSIAMMYKRFGLHMTRYIINTANMALRGASEKDRAVARFQIIGVLGAAALFSGVQGLPFFGEVMTLLEAFFTDDDDEPPKVVIQKFLGEPYYNGALNYLLGIEIASRISLSGLIFRENRIDKDQSALYDAIEMLGGPAVGVFMNLERGAELLSQGETYRGVEAMMPSAIKNVMKAGRFGTEGATTLRGDEIVPLSGLDIVKQAIGYTPEAYARQQERTSVTKRIDEAVREKKRKLLRKYNIAMEAGDFAEVREILKEMQAFSRKHPEDAIEGPTLTRSLRGFRQRSEEMIGGVSFGQPERAQREIEEFDPDTTLWADVFE